MYKKILLTGGSGFIGKNIQESFLSQKYDIVAPRHKDLDLTSDDSVDAFFRENTIDVVIHSAVKPGHRNANDPTGLFFNNAKMFFNLEKNKDRFKMINLGSGAIYDGRHYKPKVKEDEFGAYIPADEHGFCKYVCGKYIAKSDNIIDLRIFSIFGKYEDYAIRFISNMICKAVFDLPMTMKQNRKFDFIYVNDLMPVLDYFIMNPSRFTEYNVTPDSSVELYEVAKLIRRISGKEHLPITIAQEGMNSEYSGDNSRLHMEIPEWRLTSLEESVSQLYQWYSDNKDVINRDLLLFDK
jgi:GDP-L-fucose synthase